VADTCPYCPHRPKPTDPRNMYVMKMNKEGWLQSRPRIGEASTLLTRSQPRRAASSEVNEGDVAHVRLGCEKAAVAPTTEHIKGFADNDLGDYHKAMVLPKFLTRKIVLAIWRRIHN
jgi:hypothetical protein